MGKAARIATAAGLVVLAAASPRPAAAFECTREKEACFVSIRWPTRSIPYTVSVPEGARINPATVVDFARRAFDAWDRPRCSDLTFELRGVEGAPSADGVENVVTVLESGWAPMRDPKAAGLTTMVYRPSEGTILRGRIELNDENFRLLDATRTCGAPEDTDLGAVLTHEVGHFVGLAHPCELTELIDPARPPPCPVIDCNEVAASLRDENGRLPTMWPVVPHCDTSMRQLTTAEIDGLCFIYPADEATRGCFSLPKKDTSYVTSRPFGCAAAGAGDPALVVLFLLAAIPRKKRSGWQRRGTGGGSRPSSGQATGSPSR